MARDQSPEKLLGEWFSSGVTAAMEVLSLEAGPDAKRSVTTLEEGNPPIRPRPIVIRDRLFRVIELDFFVDDRLCR